jgi:hypothetical protein
VFLWIEPSLYQSQVLVRSAWLTHSANKETENNNREILIYLNFFNYYSLSFIHCSLDQHNLHQPISLHCDLFFDFQISFLFSAVCPFIMEFQQPNKYSKPYYMYGQNKTYNQVNQNCSFKQKRLPFHTTNEASMHHTLDIGLFIYNRKLAFQMMQKYEKCKMFFKIFHISVSFEKPIFCCKK